MKHFRPLRLERLEPRYAPAAGDLVASFGTGGKVVTEFPFAQGSYDKPARLATTNDGKFVVVGETNTGHGRTFGVARLLADGSRDTTFGDNGVVFSPLGFMEENVSSVAVQGDGRVVVAGFVRRMDFNYDFVVARYNVDGTLDGAFGEGGFVTTQVGMFHSLAHDLLIQPDGKIVVAGSGVFGGSFDYSVVRFLVDGALDESFAEGGIANVDFDGQIDIPNAIALDSRGRLVVVGNTSPMFGDESAAITRLLPDGTPDLSFSGDGKAVVSFLANRSSNTQQFALAIQPDNKLLVSGRVDIAEGTGVKLVRITEEGEFDETFGQEGEVYELGWIPSESMSPPIVDDNGRILIGGRQGLHPMSSQIMLTRYTSNGDRDGSFGSGGIAESEFAAVAIERPVDIVLNVDGGYAVLFAALFAETSSDLAVARFDDSGVRVDDFGEDGLTTLNFSTIHSESVLNDIAVLPDGRLLAVGTQVRVGERSRVALSRYLPNGDLDPDFGVGGKAEIGVTSFYLKGVQALPQLDGDAFVIGNSEPVAFVARIRADGTLDPEFNSGNLVTVSVDADRTTIFSAVSDGEGGLYVAGDLGFGNGSYIQRVRADGTADPEFGTGGHVALGADINLTVSAVARQRDGKLLLVGQSFPASFGGFGVATVVRLQVDGTPDPTFSEDGIAFVDFGFNFVHPQAIAILRDGRLLLSGFRGSDNRDMFVVKLASNGVLDPSFGIGGRVVTDVATAERSDALALLEDGRFYIAGSAASGEHYDMAVVGYLSNGNLDPTFGNGGVFTTSFAAYSDEASALRVLPSGDLIVGGVTTTGKAKAFALAKIEGHGVAQFPHHNAANPANVDDDPGGQVLAADAIIIIDALNQHGAYALPPPNPNAPPIHYLDPSRDGWVTAADAVIVIDYLNANSMEAGEGEAVAADMKLMAFLSPLDQPSQQRSQSFPPASAPLASRAFPMDSQLRSPLSGMLVPAARKNTPIDAPMRIQSAEGTEDWIAWLEEIEQGQKSVSSTG